MGRRWLKPVVWGLCLLPALELIVRGLTDSLGANPVSRILHTSGSWALRLLVLTLAVTPVKSITGWAAIGPLRKNLGNFAFFYACVHFLTYAILDQGLDLDDILADIVKRPFITLGFACFVALIPLAVTSTAAMTRRLGGKRWKRLHRLVYPIGIGGVVHFAWSVKKDLREPLFVGAVLGILLAYRIVTPLLRRRSAAGGVPDA